MTKKQKIVKVTISKCTKTYGTYIKGQQLVYAEWRNGHNAGLWELLPVGTTIEYAKNYVAKWAESVGVLIASERICNQ